MACSCGMNFSCFVFVITCIVVANLITTNGLLIRDLAVPDRVDFNSSDPLTLDCFIDFNNPSEEYELNKSLVIKWSLNDSLIFQWIINGQKHISMNSSISNVIVDDDARYWNGTKPTHMPFTFQRRSLNLTGYYECKVFTAGTLEVTRKKFMHVYSPADEVILQENVDQEQNLINISCGAEGMYPRPEVSLIVDNQTFKNASEYVILNRGDFYDINATYSFPTNELSSVTTFNCLISIPEVNWTNSKTFAYSRTGDGVSSNSSSYNQQAQGTDGSSNICCSMHSLFLTFWIVVVQYISSSYFTCSSSR